MSPSHTPPRPRAALGRALALALLLFPLAVVSPARAGSADEPTVIDWSDGNVQAVDIDCGAFVFRNLENHQASMLYVRGKHARTCSFQADGLTFRVPPNFGLTTEGASTLFSFVRIDNDVIVSWTPGY